VLTGTESSSKATGLQKRMSGHTIPVFVENGIAKPWRRVGDVQFEIQGVPINTLVANLREVDWQRFSPLLRSFS
jgi:predicted lysophospholipase L1 biosynthesis ABC-type transport system permease subunit